MAVKADQNMQLRSRNARACRSRTANLALPALAICASTLAATAAGADVTISTGATTNMSCSGGVCAPTASTAVLNVEDLESLLSAGSVEVTTIGTSVQTHNIRVIAPLTWSNGAALTLNARRSVVVDNPIDVAGAGTLAIFTGGKTGTFSIEREGNVQFPAGGNLDIDGASYTLVNSIATLASAIAANPSGDYALAESYDASADGTYSSSPVPTTFYGTLDGLGNSISHLSIDADKGSDVGLFSNVYASATVQHLRLKHLKISATGKRQLVGGVAGEAGNLYEDEADGTINVGDSSGGGLAGDGENISNSHSSVRVVGAGIDASVGSLVGQMDGPIVNSYATGDVIGTSGGCIGGLSGSLSGGDAEVANSFATGEARIESSAKESAVGGLVGCPNGEITNSYATGAAISTVPKNTKKAYVKVGGLAGYAVGKISYSYSVGRVHAASVVQGGGYGIYKGGFVGIVQQNGSEPFTDTYWDTITSKDDQGSSNGWSGITGLTTEQLQSGLPPGFDASIWAENPAINNGMPYLRSNPPKK
jgi:hypothetical protein